jgi:hypothetical protein
MLIVEVGDTHAISRADTEFLENFYDDFWSQFNQPPNVNENKSRFTLNFLVLA